MSLHAIVPAGGAGRRLWPLSTPQHPKFLQALAPGRPESLLQLTAQRLAPLSASLTVVTGQIHAPAVREQLNALDLPWQILAEPSPRDSMAAIGLATAVLAERYGRSDEVLLGSFAADHLISRDEDFRACVRAALAPAAAGYLTTIGITPTGPETGFGYIKDGGALDLLPSSPEATATPTATAASPCPRRVERFVEKPDAPTARSYLSQGGYWWNAGMFVASTRTILDGLAQLLPDLHRGLIEIAQAWDSERREAVLADIWPALQAIAIDHALAEPLADAAKVAVVPAPADLGWSDVGDFNSLSEVCARADQANLFATPAHLDQAPGAFIATQSLKGVAIIGIEDAVVVEAGGRLLVTTAAHAQRVKAASVAADEWPKRGAAAKNRRV